MDFLNCEYITQCSGCQIAHLKKSDQIDFKKNSFIELWKKTFNKAPEINFIRSIESEFRDRADLTVQNGQNCEINSENDYNEYQKIGFYKKDSRDILNIKNCPLMSKNLSKIYEVLRKINFPIQKGSLRIRVSPKNKKGLWIDFSNEDIKKLLDEKTTLEQLTKIFDVIEIGQKRKKLSIINDQYKLTDPELNPWFETYDKDLNPLELQMNVGSFSQTGFTTNKLLIKELIGVFNQISNSTSETKNLNWLELCSGSGNLTMPLLSVFKNVVATELDENAVEALNETAKKMNLLENLKIEKINIHKPSEKLESLLSNIEGVLADPPRSGLQGFLEVISKIQKQNLPKNFVYVSCFAETLISDLKILTNLGYCVRDITGVDQFPHSTHCEWLVHLSQV